MNRNNKLFTFNDSSMRVLLRVFHKKKIQNPLSDQGSVISDQQSRDQGPETMAQQSILSLITYPLSLLAKIRISSFNTSRLPPDCHFAPCPGGEGKVDR